MTSIPGATSWFTSSAESLSSLSLDESNVLRGEKDRIVGDKGIGVVVKCYSGLENSLRVCDLVEVVGILEMPIGEDVEGDDEENGVVIHAVMAKKRHLHELVKSQNPPLTSGTHPPPHTCSFSFDVRSPDIH
jgi:hypothetical protein